MDDDVNIMHLLSDTVGGSEKTETINSSNKTSVKKDQIVQLLIPDTISECSIYLNKNTTCVSNNILTDISRILDINHSDIMSHAKKQLNCDSEKCVLMKLEQKLGRDRVANEISLRLKISGPTDNKLLSNVNIDKVMNQFTTYFNDFYPYKFNMLNYASYSYVDGYVYHQPDTLATILFTDLYNGRINNKKYRCAACVINSDTYQGAGKHWMALFVDTRSTKKYTVEFFNSSGNAPAPEFINWLEKTKTGLELITEDENSNIPVSIIRSSSQRHQKSKTECGLYSLFYIWARLNNIPPEYFMQNHIPDQLMFEFRQHLFDDPTRKRISKFDWDTYENTVKLLWEK